MRKTPTLGERELWRLLRDRSLEGAKFRRQAVIGPYIVDFVCFARRLVVEVDGYFHALNADRDARRDAWLAGEGYRILRLPDRLVLNAPEEALRLIRAALSPTSVRSATPHPTPSGGHLLPQAGEGRLG
jgi:very-short-patch-repair endonuclease